MVYEGVARAAPIGARAADPAPLDKPAVDRAPSDADAGAAALPLPGKRIPIPIALLAIAIWGADMIAIMGASLVVERLGIAPDVHRILPIAAVCYTGIVHVTGGYDFESLLYFKSSWPKVANAWLCTVLAVFALALALGSLADRPLSDIMFWFVGGVIALGVARAITITPVRGLKRAGAFNGRTAIVGTGQQGADLADHLASSDGLALTLVGFFNDAPVSAEHAAALPAPYFGGMPELVAAIRAGAIDKVFVALPWSDEARLRAVVLALTTTPVEIRLSPDRAGFVFARRPISSLAGLSVITLLEQPLSDIERVLKRIEDVVLASAALIALAPLMAFAALAIRLTSPGPILFHQPREGFNCRSFDILKFRTMHHHPASATGELVQTQRRDPRVTRVGALLRRTSIDELPQLFNVLRGQMSLVGPRPHAVATRAGGKLFAEVAATYAQRHKVKPGLTGWAQVCGWRGETATEHQLARRLEHDIYYVEHWSIWFDLYILARTAATVLLQRTAY